MLMNRTSKRKTDLSCFTFQVATSLTSKHQIFFFFAKERERERVLNQCFLCYSFLNVVEGLEGSGLTAFIQYPFLASSYEIRCLTIPLEDRSTFMQLIQRVEEELKVGVKEDER